jgi:hypothetical protein
MERTLRLDSILGRQRVGLLGDATALFLTGMYLAGIVGFVMTVVR